MSIKWNKLDWNDRTTWPEFLSTIASKPFLVWNEQNENAYRANAWLHSYEETPTLVMDVPHRMSYSLLASTGGDYTHWAEINGPQE